MKQLCAIVQKMTSFADFQKNKANMNITQESIDDLNAKIKVESIPELRDTPILPVFFPISWEIFPLIDFSTNSSAFSSVCFSWKFSGSSLFVSTW